MKEDLEVMSGWELNQEEMKVLSQLDIQPDDPVGSMCVLGAESFEVAV